MIYPHDCAGHSMLHENRPCPSRGRMAYLFTAADGTQETLSLCLKHAKRLFDGGVGIWSIRACATGSPWDKVELIAERPGSYETRSSKWFPVEEEARA